jgi:uncharacterized coiled-coil protein SlyX
LENDIVARLQEEHVNKLLLLIDLLKKQVVTQQALNESLVAQVNYLTSRIAELENNQKKNNTNSGEPPRTDIGKRN